MNKNISVEQIKVVYYVDIDDNTKGSICAIPSSIDMRDPKVVDWIAEKIKESHILDSFMKCHSKDIAKAIAHHEFSNIGRYEFGVEETESLAVC